MRLKRADVELVIIDGVCSVLHGVSLVTFDLGICCRFSKGNLYRIEAALKEFHPRPRLVANKLPLELTDNLCERLKNLYVSTDLGVVDCLGEVAGIGDYEACPRRSVLHRMADAEFRILDLDAIIAAKEAVGRDKDIAAVKQLRAIKERIEQTER